MSDRLYRRYNPDRRNRWQDWLNLLLAIWLFFSPWILQFGQGASTAQPAAGSVAVREVSLAAWNAWVLGVIIFIVALSAIGRMELWQEWITLLLGIWVFVAPWVLGFSSSPFGAAAWDHWIVGALVFIFSVSNISDWRSQRNRVPPSLPDDRASLHRDLT